MKRIIALTVILMMLSFGLFFMSCDNEEALQTLYEIANSTEGLESLVVLISFIDENAEVDPELEEGFSDTTITATVFAPNNAAFADFFETTGVITEDDITGLPLFDGLSDTEIADALGEVLGLHVILDQKLTKADIIADADGVIGPTEYDDVEIINLEVTINGDTVTVTPDDGGTGADIITADIEASNGIAHIIDAVLLPVLD
jgi:uncharacterized surface protein with fasciclin (FAS1) repeats